MKNQNWFCRYYTKKWTKLEKEKKKSTNEKSRHGLCFIEGQNWFKKQMDVINYFMEGTSYDRKCQNTRNNEKIPGRCDGHSAAAGLYGQYIFPGGAEDRRIYHRTF